VSVYTGTYTSTYPAGSSGVASLFPLNVIIEILVNGTWRDVSMYVYQRDTLTITGGRANNGDTAQPASVNITFNNRDGRFSPNNASGAFYPYLQRNTQLRISIDNTSSSGNVYDGYRFWGEVPEWPPLSDISGNDVYVSVTASGPLRRIRSGGGEGSALTRYYASLTGLYAPIGYWPCEEDENTELIGAGTQGGASMTVVSGAPKWKAVSDFNGSAPVGVLNGSTWTGITSTFGTSGDDVFLSAGTFPWIASTTTADVRVWGPAGGGSKGQEGSSGGSGGGGGAYARDSAVALTPGQQYYVTVGAGGQPGNWNTGGNDGTPNSSFTGDAVTVTAHAGKGSNANGASGAPGGTTSGAATANFAGGAGGGSASFNQGGGGGGSAGTAAAGNAGSNAVFGSAGSGGSPRTGGGGGGDGGGFSPQRDGKDGSSPGGAGGGGWANNSKHTFGGAGAPGKVELIYTASGGGTQPSNNVIRFIVFVPKHGGNNGKVLCRTLGSGTVARLDVIYGSGGKMKLQGWSSAPALLFDSGYQSFGADGQTLMVSAELAVSGADVAWAFSAIKPGGSGVVAKTSGTVTTATMGSVSQVIAAPNGDITKTAMGHFSVQYALIALWKVSQALNGHHAELGIDRFKRLANEQALGNLSEFSETVDHWGFETGTQSWAANNAAVTQSSVTLPDGSWPSGGSKSLLITASGGAGSWSAHSPVGTSGQPVLPGDVVGAAADVYAPAALGAVHMQVSWFDAAGTFLSTSSGAIFAPSAGQVGTVTIGAADGCIAPATAAFFCAQVADSETKTAGTLLYVDHVRVHPQMGPQTRKRYHQFLEEIEDLDQGIMKEAKELWGLKYRTRIKLINQSPSVTLDYAQAMISPPLAPVIDTVNVKNDITVHRHKGSKVQVTLNSGGMSILEPPQGSGRFKKRLKAVAAADEQLAALAAHLLLLGTVSDERYPTITVNLVRCGIPGNALAPLMSAVAGVEIGDVIELDNLPFWYPSATTKQLVVGYTETLNAYEWTCTFNCVPYTPYIQVSTSLRRW